MASSHDPSHSRARSSRRDALGSGRRARRRFKALFETYYEPLCRFAERYVNVPTTAEEVVQDVLMEVWRNRGQFSDEGPPKAYLYKATRHRALDAVRRQRAQREWIEEAKAVQSAAPAPQHAPEHDVHRKELEDAARRAVEALPTQQRRVYVLHRHHGLTYAEIAEVMGISVHTVDTHMTRAFASLREQLADWLPVPERPKDG